MSRQEFEGLVADSLTIVPEEFRGYVANVPVVVEEEPSETLLRDLGISPDESLFGLYEGTPLTERTTEYSALPDRIVIFRRPLLEEFADPLDVRREVARTVIHEVAHHFGIDEERLV